MSLELVLSTFFKLANDDNLIECKSIMLLIFQEMLLKFHLEIIAMQILCNLTKLFDYFKKNFQFYFKNLIQNFNVEIQTHRMKFLKVEA
jgi:hypothetical protein